MEYTRLLLGPVRAEAYPYESLYINGEIMGKSALDVVRCYREAAVSISGDFLSQEAATMSGDIAA